MPMLRFACFVVAVVCFLLSAWRPDGERTTALGLAALTAALMV